MLQCMLNIACSQIHLSLRLGQRKHEEREEQSGGGSAFKQLGCPTAKFTSSNSQLEKAIFMILATTHIIRQT